MNKENNIELPENILNLDAKLLDNYCKRQGKLFAKGDDKGNYKVSTSKLRNFFTKVTSLRTFYRNPGNITFEDFYKKVEREVILLKPALAYSYGRDNKLKNFYFATTRLIDITIKSLEKEISNIKETKNAFNKLESIENFFSILEGFVAYHKFYGGQD